MIHYVNDDIINAKQMIICHGVNCQGVMGSGVAKALRTKWPEIFKSYRETYESYKDTFQEDSSTILLGKINPVKVTDKIILNCFTQEFYGRVEGKRYASYDAIYSCLEYIKGYVEYKDLPKDIAMPPIGCGLGGLSWSIVKPIINKVLSDYNIYVYYLGDEVFNG